MECKPVEIELRAAMGACDTDWQGRIIEEKDASDFIITMDSRIICDAFAVGIRLRSYGPKEHYESCDNVRDAVAWTTRQVLPTHLKESHAIDLFEEFKVYLDESLPLPENIGKYMKRFDAKLTADAFASLESQVPSYREAVGAFDAAREQLRTFASQLTAHGFSNHQTEIRGLINFLESSLRASGRGWDTIGKIRHGFEEVIRRKSPSHPGYKHALRDIQSGLSFTDAPQGRYGEVAREIVMYGPDRVLNQPVVLWNELSQNIADAVISFFKDEVGWKENDAPVDVTRNKLVRLERPLEEPSYAPLIRNNTRLKL